VSKVARIPELDGLRGIAIGLVIVEHYFIYHSFVPPHTIASYSQVPFRLAWTGVDLFFVLSGFLIGGILLDVRESSNFFKVFYARRFFRIVPLYAACLTIFFLVFALTKVNVAPRFSWMYEGRFSWAPYILFLQNLWMARWNAVGAFPLAVTWSLAVEEQFYLTLPILVKSLRPDRLLTILVAGVVAAPFIRTVLYILRPEFFFSWFMLMPCRADSLLLGVLGAMFMRSAKCRRWVANKRWVFQYFLFPILLVGLTFFSLRAWSPKAFLMLSVGYSWLAVFYLSVLLYALLWKSSWTSACLRLRWLTWLGIIAYGTYLLHEFILGLVFGLIWSGPPALFNLQRLAVALVSCILTLLVCKLSWEFFEKPLVQIGHRWRYLFHSPPALETPKGTANRADPTSQHCTPG